MNQLKNVVVAIDFSESSRTALVQAARMASLNKARLHVIHVIEDLVMSDMADSLKMSPVELSDLAITRAHEATAQWLKEAGCSDATDADVRIGTPLDMILRKAHSVEADLLVLGEVGSTTPGRGAGVLATKCLRKAPCKVMLVNETHHEPFKMVLACVDFSETSRQVVTQAVRVAQQDGSQIHFLHVFDLPSRRLGHMLARPNIGTDFMTEYRKTLRYRLQNFVGDTGGLNVRYDVHENSSAGHGIASYARWLHADLVVLGTTGQTNLKYVLLGSTAERLLRDVPCSVLAIKPPWFRSPALANG